MKARYLVPLFLLLSLMACKSPTPACALDLSYAQMQGYVVLYSVVGEDSYSPVCVLPSTYFVRISGEESNGYLPVVYDGLTGFVSASAVAKVDFEPLYKYADGSLTLSNDGHPVNLRSAPDHTQDNILASLNSGQTLKYYGAIDGTEQVHAIGPRWYFVRTDSGQLGYIYSLYANAIPIPENTVVPVPAPPEDESANAPAVDLSTPNGVTEEAPDSNGTREAIIVLALCAPVVIVVYLLFRKRA